MNNQWYQKYTLSNYLEAKTTDDVKYPIDKYDYAFTKFPRKSGISLEEFIDLIINYNITKNLKSRNLNYENYFCPLNNVLKDENFNEIITNKKIIIGRVMLNEIVLCYKCLKNGEVFFEVNNYTKKFKNFKTTTISNNIMKFVNYFTKNEKCYRVLING